ncbi:MAG: Sb-PDE family phosphodiesterase [Candidatus Neomarinimicrobiota bacterium]
MNHPKRRIYRRILIPAVLLATISTAQVQRRQEIILPDLPGYITLKCDFHMHTIFSDGLVWPTVRVEEAWRDGLDAIALTDHIESTPYKNDVIIDYDRPYAIAEPVAQALGIILIKGAEITRSMPPGHFNVLFAENIDTLKTPSWETALRTARQQDAFVFWNHPGWVGQQLDGSARWDSIHDALYEQGLFQGVEVVNHFEYYPEALAWALEKNLTVLANSDIHNAVEVAFDADDGNRRPLTLVFVRERSAAGIRDALRERRTVACWGNNLYGSEKYLRPLFDGSIVVEEKQARIYGRWLDQVRIRNNSAIDYRLKLRHDVENVRVPREITLFAQSTILFELIGTSSTYSGARTVKIPYSVENLVTGPGEGLAVEIAVDVTFIPTQ